MKLKVFISSSCGIEKVTNQDITILQNEIVFNEIETYRDSTEMGFEAFIDRMNLDRMAKPKINLCKKEIIDSEIKVALSDGVDDFLFLIPSALVPYFEPIIVDCFRDERVQYTIYPMRSELYPVSYMAQESIALYKNGKTINSILDMLEYVDDHNAMYLYSPIKDKTIGAERYMYDDEVYSIAEEGNYFYIIRGTNVSVTRLKVKQKTIEPYFTKYIREITDKAVLPYIIYTNRDSKYVEVLKKNLSTLFPKMKRPKMVLASPSFVMKYGSNCCGIGYILKEE